MKYSFSFLKSFSIFISAIFIPTTSFALDEDDIDAACKGKWGQTVEIGGQEIHCVEGVPPDEPPGTSGGGGSTSGGSSGDPEFPGGGGSGSVPEGTKAQCEKRKNTCLNNNMGDPKSDWSVDNWRKRIGSCFTIEDCNLQDTYQESNDGSDVSLNGACMYCLISKEYKNFKCTYDTPAKKLCKDRRREMNKQAAAKNMDIFIDETLPKLDTTFIERILEKAKKINRVRETTTTQPTEGTLSQ